MSAKMRPVRSASLACTARSSSSYIAPALAPWSRRQVFQPTHARYAPTTMTSTPVMRLPYWFQKAFSWSSCSCSSRSSCVAIVRCRDVLRANRGLCGEGRRPGGDIGERDQALRAAGRAKRLQPDFAARQLVVAEDELARGEV